MKKAITLLLTLLMVLSLAACGGQATTEESSTTNEQTETTTPEVEETEQNEESTETVETESAGTEVAFDNSWTDNAYEKQIPKIPFDNWSVGEAHDENAYLIKVENALYTDVKEYGELLTTCAFTQNLWVADDSEGIEYRLSADSESGYSINYDFNAYSYDEPITGLLDITIYDNQANGASQGLAACSSWGDAEIDALVPGLPEAEWDGDVSEKPYGKEYHLSCYSLTKDEIMAYIDVLKEAGFDNNMDEEPNGYLYRFMGSNANNEVTVQIRIDATANAEVLLTEAFATINK